MKRNPWILVTLVGSTLLFGLAVALRHRFDPWLTNLLAGLLSGSAALLVLRHRLRRLLAFQWPSVLLAMTTGVAMVLLTHIGYRVLVVLVPQLDAVVKRLYFDIAQTAPPMALMVPLIILIVVAEELVWRGVTFDLLEEQQSRSRVQLIFISTLLYALPQLIGGSWILVGAALSIGMLLGLQRALCGRLTEAMITHAIWSVGIFGLVPLV